MSISIRDLINLGEGCSVEFKQSLPPKSETYLKTVIAYADSWRQPHKARLILDLYENNTRKDRL